MQTYSNKEEGQEQPYNANPLKLTEHNGVLYPYYFGQEPRVRLENIKNIQSKTGDIFLCSYPKSGTHWIMEMVNMLVAGSTEHTTKFNFLDPMIICDQVLDSIPCPRVFQSHLRFNQLPDSFLKRNGKIIYILRNPKDVSVSLYSFVQKEGRIKYAGTWGEFFKVFINGKVAYSSWFDHVSSWEREMEKGRHPIHFVSYEDLQEDAVRELDRISKFLSLNHPNSFLQAIVESRTFTKMRNQKYLYQIMMMIYNLPDLSLYRQKVLLAIGEDGIPKNKASSWTMHTRQKCLAAKLSSVMADKIFKLL